MFFPRKHHHIVRFSADALSSMCVHVPVCTWNIASAANAAHVVETDDGVDEATSLYRSEPSVEDNKWIFCIAKELPNPAAPLIIAARLVAITVCAVAKVRVKMCVAATRELSWP